MKLLFVFALVFICKAFATCPAQNDMDCYFYRSDPQCDTKLTFIEVNGQRCDGCNMCIPPSAGSYGGCPNIPCPYNETVNEILRQDCGIKMHQMQMNLNGRDCNACLIAEYNCVPWFPVDPPTPPAMP